MYFKDDGYCCGRNDSFKTDNILVRCRPNSRFFIYFAPLNVSVTLNRSPSTVTAMRPR